MLDKNDVVSKVKKLQLPEGEYIVFGSGPMAALEIRKVNDIDLLVTPKLRVQLAERGWKQTDKGLNDTPVESGDFEAHDSWIFSSYAPTLKELLSRALIIDNVAFASIQDVLKWKIASDRDKDKEDIKKIEAFLAHSKRDQ